MYPICKRGMDFLVSFVALVVASPVLLILMALIRLESPGSPVFAQTRIGKDGKPFTIYKLRTMRKTAPKSVATGELVGAQSYITPFGGFLRKTSLDELPQLFNIVRGDMSLVGPRPLVPEEEDVHKERLEKGAYRVCPGITGWAQVNGRDQVQSGMKANLDAYYADSMCFALDMKIIFRTAFYVLTGRGIQEGAQTGENDTREDTSDAEANDH